MPDVDPPPPARRFRENCRRGPTTELHNAAYRGSAERTKALLSSGSFDIDEVDLMVGFTPLIYAAGAGHGLVVKILLDEGADVSVVGPGGCTAVHVSVQEGHVAATTMLIKAGADLEAVDDHGHTPLLLAVDNGDWGMIRVLVQGGANADHRSSTGPNGHSPGAGQTPLHRCAFLGHVDTTRELLRAKANPLLPTPPAFGGQPVIPLDMAAAFGHLGVVRELIQHVGIKGCGGASRGVNALQTAAQFQFTDVLATLTEAGVVDTGAALRNAASFGRVAAATFLVQQQAARNPTGLHAYLESRDDMGRTPLFCCIAFSPSPRLVRLLIDAGADASSAVRIKDPRGPQVFECTPLEWTSFHLETIKTVKERPAAEVQLDMLRAIRRLLLRVESVHAGSWLWPGDVPVIDVAESSSAVDSASTPLVGSPLTATLPVLRERARRHGVLLGAQCRYSVKG